MHLAGKEGKASQGFGDPPENVGRKEGLEWAEELGFFFLSLFSLCQAWELTPAACTVLNLSLF